MTFIDLLILCACAWWSSVVNFWESDFSFNHLGPRDQTQVVKSGAEDLYPLSHLAGPKVILSIEFLSICLLQTLEAQPSY